MATIRLHDTRVWRAVGDVGLRRPLAVRHERIRQSGDACRLLYASDIHLRKGRSKILSDQVVDAARRARPDVLLLGGDVIDQRSQLDALRELVSRLSSLATVVAVSGNHDRAIGERHVSDSIREGGGTWIEQRVFEFAWRNRRIGISGPQAGFRRVGDFHVLCAHNPRIWKHARQAGYDLVLAGHLHGCQFVAFRFRDRLYPGAWFYPYNYLSHRHGSARLAVSRGVSDRVPIRWRCPREVVLCHI